MQIGRGKEGVRIGEYGTGESLKQTKDTNPVLGWIEPACDNPQWILWFTASGDAILHQKREASGGVLDDPLRIKS